MESVLCPGEQKWPTQDGGYGRGHLTYCCQDLLCVPSGHQLRKLATLHSEEQMFGTSNHSLRWRRREFLLYQLHKVPGASPYGLGHVQVMFHALYLWGHGAQSSS